jgi:hypothetical protein
MRANTTFHTRSDAHHLYWDSADSVLRLVSNTNSSRNDNSTHRTSWRVITCGPLRLNSRATDLEKRAWFC